MILVIPCPLCEARSEVFFEGAATYFCCSNCGFIFMRPDCRPSPATEAARYAKHRNSLEKKGYREHLERLAAPMRARARGEGLDYGSGPIEAFRELLSPLPVAAYDPCFFPDTRVLERSYDFICCSEVVEHFHHPKEEFERLFRLLRPGGILGILTESWDPSIDFASWSYRRDPTHVGFFQEKSFRWLERRYDWRSVHIGNGARLLQKSQSS